MSNSSSFGPWNPGIESPVPNRLRPLCTIFRAENAFTSYAQVRELSSFTGLDYVELASFRPQRLALHEILIRVSADVSVPDGEKVEDLGINFRAIVQSVLAGYVEPGLDAVDAAYRRARETLAPLIDAEVTALFSTEHHDERIARWSEQAHASRDAAERAVARALHAAVSAIVAKHGKLWGTRELVGGIAMTLALNDYGSAAIGRIVDERLAAAARALTLKTLPRQARPVVMNTKGASASGKSTIRPLQRRLAGATGSDWSDFALLSPDIWRKQLLDYSSLGEHYKYAGAFTGDELQVIDQKLDRYMARKAKRGDMSHLLIDRFRFDSFAPDSDVAGSNLLTRFGRTVYLFFMITPPASLVERAWNRGLEVGRYKAVDDTLAHAVQAYAGMPELFFTWIARTDKRVHFEFLDNDVPPGEPPRTVAFGWNDSITIFSVKRLIDVTRYRHIDVNARAPEKIFSDASSLAPNNNLSFLRDCVARFRRVDFAEARSHRVYLTLEHGRPVAGDATMLAAALDDPDAHAGLSAVAPSAFGTTSLPQPSSNLDPLRVHTLGQWR